MRSELVRKSIHTLLALTLAFTAPYLGLRGVVGAGVVLLVLFSTVRRTGHFDVFRRVERVTYGELYFAAGIILSAVLFLPTHTGAFQAGMVVLGLADPLAALVGKRFGRHSYTLFGDRLSCEGSATCAVVAGGILYLAGVPLSGAGLGGVLLAGVEAAAPRGADNLMLPVVAGLLQVLV
jgi:phytol kinase